MEDFIRCLVGAEQLAVLRDDTAVLVVDPPADATVARIFGETVEEHAASIAGKVTADVRDRTAERLSRAANQIRQQNTRKLFGHGVCYLLRGRYGLAFKPRSLRGFENLFVVLVGLSVLATSAITAVRRGGEEADGQRKNVLVN